MGKMLANGRGLEDDLGNRHFVGNRMPEPELGYAELVGLARTLYPPVNRKKLVATHDDGAGLPEKLLGSVHEKLDLPGGLSGQKMFRSSLARAQMWSRRPRHVGHLDGGFQ